MNQTAAPIENFSPSRPLGLEEGLDDPISGEKMQMHEDGRQEANIPFRSCAGKRASRSRESLEAARVLRDRSRDIGLLTNRRIRCLGGR
jgi:hypothetical protein